MFDSFPIFGTEHSVKDLIRTATSTKTFHVQNMIFELLYKPHSHTAPLTSVYEVRTARAVFSILALPARSNPIGWTRDELKRPPLNESHTLTASICTREIVRWPLYGIYEHTLV